MRRWLIAAGLIAALSAAVVLIREDETPCSVSNTAIDGVAAPGAPQDSSVALRQFLDSDIVADLPSTDPHDWELENRGDSVTYRLGKTSVHLSRQPNGWMVGAVDTTC